MGWASIRKGRGRRLENGQALATAGSVCRRRALLQVERVDRDQATGCGEELGPREVWSRAEE